MAKNKVECCDICVDRCPAYTPCGNCKDPLKEAPPGCHTTKARCCCTNPPKGEFKLQGTITGRLPR